MLSASLPEVMQFISGLINAFYQRCSAQRAKLGSANISELGEKPASQYPEYQFSKIPTGEQGRPADGIPSARGKHYPVI